MNGTRAFDTAVPVEVERIARFLPDEFVFADTGKGRCIEAARILTATLGRLGVPCRAMACGILAANAEAEPYVADGTPIEQWPSGAFTVGTWVDTHDGTMRHRDEPERRTSFGGHLIVVGDDWFADLTVAQYHRPEHGIVIDGAIAGPRDPDADAFMLRGDRTTIRWFLTPRAASWRNTPAWRQDLPPVLLERLVAVGRGET